MSPVVSCVRHKGRERLPYILFLLTSLLSLSWFRGKPLDYADMTLGTTLGRESPSGVLSALVYSLNGLSPSVYPGSPSMPTGLAYTLVVDTTHIALPLWASQFAYVFLCLFVSQTGVYSLARLLLKKEKTPSWGAALGSVLYAYGPFYQFVAGDGAIAVLSFYASYPWLILFFLRASESFPTNLHGFLGALLGLFAAAQFGSIGFTYYYHVTALASAFVLAVGFAMLKRGFSAKALYLAGFGISVVALELSIFYIFSFDLVQGPSLAQAGGVQGALVGLLVANAPYMNYLTQLTMGYFPAFLPWYPVVMNLPNVLENPFWGLGVAVLVFLPLLRRSTTARHTAPLFALLLLALAFGSGTNPPFGEAIVAAFLHFWPFRALAQTFPALQFVEQLSISLLLAASLGTMRAGRPGKRVLALLFLGALFVTGAVLPYAAGLPRGVTETTSPEGETSSTYYINDTVNIPAYYREMVSYVNSLPARGAVLTLPIVGNFHASTWYISVDNLASVLNKPVLGGGYLSTEATRPLVRAIEMWQEGDMRGLNISRLLALEGIGYVVFQGDTVNDPPRSHSPPFNMSYIRYELSRTPGLKLLASFGPDLVYSLDLSGYGAQKVQSVSYPFAIYDYAIAVNVTQNSPFDTVFTLNSSARVSCSGGYPSSGTLVFGSNSVQDDCTLWLNATGEGPLFVTLGYSAQPGTFLSIGGETFTLSQSGTVTAEVFPAPNESGTVITVVSNGQVDRTRPLVTVNALSVSLAVNASDMVFVSSLAAKPPVYLSGQGRQGVLVNSSKLPDVLHAQCGALTCDVTVHSNAPFVFVYYGGYSRSYTLSVNGSIDRAHYQAFGSYNAWLVNRTGILSLTLTHTDAILVPEGISLATWFVVLGFFAVAPVRRKQRGG